MDPLERIFTDHLGQLHAPERQGALDLGTMAMHLPSGWREDPAALYVRAHELTHLRLTYQTGLGILLDTLGGVASIKLLNLLKTHESGAIRFPLDRNLDASNIDRDTRAHIAYCLSCMATTNTIIHVWRPLQEATATYVMLEQGTDMMIHEYGLPQKRVEAARKQVLGHLSGIYKSGYHACQQASQVIGDRLVFPFAVLASDIPLYSFGLLTRKGSAIGTTFGEELTQLRHALALPEMDPMHRFQRLVSNAKKSRNPLPEDDDLDSLNVFAVPDLFPDEDWAKQTDEWLLQVIQQFCDLEPEKAHQALSLYADIVHQGWPPVILETAATETQIGMVRNFEEAGLLRYALGTLRRACLNAEPVEFRLPDDWRRLGIAPWLEDFLDAAAVHQLPVTVKLV